jgi:polysaccharide biosynthesis/export protein
MIKVWTFATGAALVLGACASDGLDTSQLAAGASSYKLLPEGNSSLSPADYRIGPMDALDITVFEEPELSVKAVPVDAFGNVALPLIGTVPAAGRTATQLAQELTGKLGQKYLKDPKVTVVVSAPVPQKVTVQGEVSQPGVYEIKGPTTLLNALSLAKGETKVAAMDRVVVFRSVNGQRMGAVFNIYDIRSGKSPDPAILTNDQIIVGLSKGKQAWDDFLRSIPLVNIFRVF